MATADEYARWIVENQAKKGSPEFETVAKAYQEAKSQPMNLNQADAKSRESIAQAPYNLGAKVTDLASQYLPPSGAAAVGTAANLGLNAVPIMMGGGMGKAVAPLMESGAKNLMQRAIKPLVGDLERGKVEPAIQTMLEQGFSPTNAGVKAMRDKASGYSDQVSGILDRSNKVIDVNPADQNLAALADRLRAGTMGARKIEDAQGVSRALHEHPSVEAGTMSVQDAQSMKQANYRDIGDNAYGLAVKEKTERDALKALTAALRKGIERAEPEVGPLNAKAGELINAAKVSQRRALMEGNKDPLSLGTSIAAAVHNPAAALGMWANSSSAAKAMLARMLYSSKGGAEGAGQMSGAGGAAMADYLRRQE